MEELLKYDHPWVREYFHGPRGRRQPWERSGVRWKENRPCAGRRGDDRVRRGGRRIRHLKLRGRPVLCLLRHPVLGRRAGLTNDLPVFYRGLRRPASTTSSLARRHPALDGRERLTEDRGHRRRRLEHRHSRAFLAIFEPFIAGAPFIQIVGRLDVDQVKPKRGWARRPIRRSARVRPSCRRPRPRRKTADQGRRDGRPAERAVKPRCRRGRRHAAQPVDDDHRARQDAAIKPRLPSARRRRRIPQDV